MSKTDWEKRIEELEKIVESKVNSEKKIAQAILDAQEMYAGSYSEEDGVHIPDEESCFRIVCKLNGLSPNLWFLLSLANYWCNDIQDWAEDVLAGKNIYSVLTKDINASQHLENCPCDHASKEACDQCQETGAAKPDSAGRANPQNYC